MNAEAKQRGIAEAAVARADLYDTLGQLQDRLNYAKRVDDAVDDAKLRVVALKRDRPGVFAAGVGGAAVAAGLVVWGIAAAVLKRF